MANGITTRVPFPAHRISQCGCASMQLVVTGQPLQAPHSCSSLQDLPQCTVFQSWSEAETRAKDLGSRTVATLFACTIPLCAEDFESQHQEFLRSEHSLHQFLVWFLLIFHALRFANCGSQQFFSVITLTFDKFWNTSHAYSPPPRSQ